MNENTEEPGVFSGPVHLSAFCWNCVHRTEAFGAFCHDCVPSRHKAEKVSE